MRDVVDTIEKDGWTANLYIDEDPTSPNDWDQLGTLVTWHRRYRFQEDGEKSGMTGGEFMRKLDEERAIYLAVGMHDHSGISLYVGSGPALGDGAGWDSGQVGWIYVSREKVLKEYGVKRISKKTRARVIEALYNEVEAWDQFVRGDVYGYVITGPSGESGIDDSCWGFYGFEYAKKEMKVALDAAIRWEKEEREKTERMMAL